MRRTRIHLVQVLSSRFRTRSTRIHLAYSFYQVGSGPGELEITWSIVSIKYAQDQENQNSPGLRFLSSRYRTRSTRTHLAYSFYQVGLGPGVLQNSPGLQFLSSTGQDQEYQKSPGLWFLSSRFQDLENQNLGKATQTKIGRKASEKTSLPR